MPVLTLPYGLERWQEHIPLLISVMKFPNDAIKRNGLVLLTQLARAIGEEPEGVLPLTFAQTRLLMQTPSHEVLMEESMEVMKKGVVAGDLLLRLFTLHGNAPELASINRTVFWMEHSIKGTASRGGRIKAASAKSIFNAWKAYKSVAHLHAASAYFSLIGMDSGFNSSENDFRFYLGAVKAFERFALSYSPPKAGKQPPLISPDEIWRIEHNFDVPEITPVIKNISPGCWERIKSYEAPVPAQ
jgi:hypothetical protein